MADVSVTRIERRGDTIAILGAGFTRTTTTAFVDGENVEFTFVSEEEITITPPSSDDAQITVGKGMIVTEPFRLSDAGSGDQSEANTDGSSGQSSLPGHTDNISTTAEGEDDLADVTPQELIAADNSIKPSEPEPQVAPEVRGEHNKSSDMRQAVHQSAVTRIDEDLGIGPRDPYPVGRPPDQREIFHSIHGYYKPEDEQAPNP